MLRIVPRNSAGSCSRATEKYRSAAKTTASSKHSSQAGAEAFFGLSGSAIAAMLTVGTPAPSDAALSLDRINRSQGPCPKFYGLGCIQTNILSEARANQLHTNWNPVRKPCRHRDAWQTENGGSQKRRGGIKYSLHCRLIRLIQSQLECGFTASRH